MVICIPYYAGDTNLNLNLTHNTIKESNKTKLQRTLEHKQIDGN
jgi:hypothetical protein